MQDDIVARNNEANLKVTATRGTADDGAFNNKFNHNHNRNNNNNSDNCTNNHHINHQLTATHRPSQQLPRQQPSQQQQHRRPTDAADMMTAVDGQRTTIGRGDDPAAAAATMDESVLQQFYDHKNVFVTGGTGESRDGTKWLPVKTDSKVGSFQGLIE